tara:strand:- start:6862 stop:7113 length:252 start_codon:yes stop_codon:yes gene_type:complete
MFNNIEQKTIEILKKQHGSVHDTVEPIQKEVALMNANEYLEAIIEMYRENPSSTNYNYMIAGLINYQYWFQKETNEFILTEEF